MVLKSWIAALGDGDGPELDALGVSSSMAYWRTFCTASPPPRKPLAWDAKLSSSRHQVDEALAETCVLYGEAQLVAPEAPTGCKVGHGQLGEDRCCPLRTKFEPATMDPPGNVPKANCAFSSLCAEASQVISCGGRPLVLSRGEN